MLARDGRPLLSLCALVLLFAGVFAFFIAARGEFLPHDIAFLGVTPAELCAVHECRIVHFMVHDRVSFGGALVAIGVVYLWIVAGPLERGERWGWDVLPGQRRGRVRELPRISRIRLSRLMARSRDRRSRATVRRGFDPDASDDSLGPIGPFVVDKTDMAIDLERSTLPGAGTVTRCRWWDDRWRPDDHRCRDDDRVRARGLAFHGCRPCRAGLAQSALVPLIAHDRAGFGGAVCCCGVALAGVIWRAELDRAARQALGVAGLAGFGTAVFVHPAIGYTDLWHLSPAVAGAMIFAVGWMLTGGQGRA